MRVGVAVIAVFLASMFARGADALTKKSGVVLLLPGKQEPLAVKVEVSLDGQSPNVAWEAFLDKMLDFFDADADGSLSRTEACRLPPFPLPGRKELSIDFARLDADGDGQASRAELKSYCGANGFGPIVAITESPSEDDLNLAELLSRRLDADGDGKLTRDELRRAPLALRKFDLNEDEFLDLTELLESTSSGPRKSMPQVKLGDSGDGAGTILHLNIGAKRPGAGVEGKNPGHLRLVAPTGSRGLHRLHDPEGGWLMTFGASRVMPGVGSAGGFLASLFKMALGDRTALTKQDLEEDPALSGLLELFRYADRNADDRLSLAELEAYLKLIELGMQSQVWVRVTDRGRNPFWALDADIDGRLSYRELARACEVLCGDAEVTRLPAQVQLSFAAPLVSSWGGVPIPAVAKRTRPAPSDVPKEPRWFQALDYNGDGVVSPREFAGPPEVFRKLDEDADGVISADEAARAAGR